MTKFLIILFVVVGWFAASVAYFPSVWNPFQWTLPFTTFHLSFGLVALLGLVVVTHRSIK